MRRAGTFFALFVVAIIVSAAGPARASGTGDEAQLAQLLNTSRGAAGLAPLAVVSDLTAMAEQHAADMAAQGRIFHQSLSGIDGQRVGENVGEADSIDAVHQLFMSSSEHRANILGDYAEVGVGVAWSNGQAYVDELFRMPWAATPAAAPAPVPAADPAPAPAPDPPVITIAPTTTAAPPETEAPAVAPDPTTTTTVTTVDPAPRPSLAAHTEVSAAAPIPHAPATDAVLAPAALAFALVAGLFGTHLRLFSRQ